MIHDNETNAPSKIFEAMKNSQHNFYVTGNRFFGLSDCNSNHDFFVQEIDDSFEDETVKEFLRKIGFHISPIILYEDLEPVEDLEPIEYRDEEILTAFAHTVFNINVYIVRDAKTKQEIQQLALKTIGNDSFIKIVSRFNTLEQTAFWRFTFDFCKKLQKEERERRERERREQELKEELKEEILVERKVYSLEENGGWGTREEEQERTKQAQKEKQLEEQKRWEKWHEEEWEKWKEEKEQKLKEEKEIHLQSFKKRDEACENFRQNACCTHYLNEDKCKTCIVMVNID